MIADILSTAEQKMKATIEHAKEELAGIRTGRAHPAMFNKIMVDYYGSPTPLQQLATFQVPEARVVLISPFDRNAMNGIEKAIRDSDLGVNPANDGQHVRIVLPQLTEERRKDLVKMAKKYTEEAKVAIRNVRRDVNEALKKLHTAKEISEDDLHKAQEDVQKSTDNFVKRADAVLAEKEKEIMEI